MDERKRENELNEQKVKDRTLGNFPAQKTNKQNRVLQRIILEIIRAGACRLMETFCSLFT